MAAKFVQLTFGTLSEFRGGLLERMLAAAVNRVAMDLQAAPEIADWRKIPILIRAKPVIEDGELADIILEFEVGPAKVPSRVTSARAEVKQGAGGHKQIFLPADAKEAAEA